MGQIPSADIYDEPVDDALRFLGKEACLVHDEGVEGGTGKPASVEVGAVRLQIGQSCLVHVQALWAEGEAVVRSKASVGNASSE